MSLIDRVLGRINKDENRKTVFDLQSERSERVEAKAEAVLERHELLVRAFAKVDHELAVKTRAGRH